MNGCLIPHDVISRETLTLESNWLICSHFP
jgi:hypothetical protein